MALTAAVPADVSEEYYQISGSILSSFPKYRPPLDLFVFNEKVQQLVPFSRKGTRLSNEQVEEVAKQCAEGNLFVSRSDHPIYSQHIAKQLDLVLVDKNLKEAEVVGICLTALDERLKEFFDQPVKPVFEKLESDTLVVTEYLWEDPNRLKLFLRRLWTGEQSLARHSLNTMFVGLFLLLDLSKKEPDLSRKEFDQAAMALLLHDVGMAKVPAFIAQKEGMLKPDERSKIEQHVLAGYAIMRKLDQMYPAMEQSTMEHQERLDGSGYPQHTKDMSPFGRLVAVADAFSAMIEKRPYADAKDFNTAARELAFDQKHFDPTFSAKLIAAALAGTFGGER